MAYILTPRSMKSYRYSKAILACFVILALSSFTTEPGSEFLIVNTEQSTVAWTGYYAFNFDEHRGTIRLTKGEIEVAHARITGGFFELDMNSIEDVDMRGQGNAKEDLENHLKSDDFFSVAKYPSARFTITKTKERQDGPNHPNYEITGTLTLKGVTNTLTFPATVELKDGKLQATAKLKFDRTRWNVHYNSGKIFSAIGDEAISDAIGLEIHLIANPC